MSDPYVFVSYSRAQAAEVGELIAWIEARGLRVWYDRDLGPGRFREEIMQRVSAASGVIAILTEEGVGPESSGWVSDELGRASDDGTTILPCIVGDFEMPEAIASKLHAFQKVDARSVADLRGDAEFAAMMDYFADALAGRPVLTTRAYIARATGAGEEAGAAVAEWYAIPPPPEDQALALAIATLVDEPAEIVVAVAADLEAAMTATLRDETQDERAKRPRTVGLRPLSAQLNEIHARRVEMRRRRDDHRIEVLRFDDPNWRHDLLTHVWREHSDVQGIFVAWIGGLLDDARTEGLGSAVGRALGILAQERLDSMLHTVVRPWLALDEPGRLGARLDVVDGILASAVERRGNIPAVRTLLENMAAGRTPGGAKVPAAEAALYRLVALRLGLNRVALRRPELALDVLRRLDRRLLRDPGLDRVALGSAALRGQRLDADAPEADLSGLRRFEPETSSAEGPERRDAGDDEAAAPDGEAHPAEGPPPSETTGSASGAAPAGDVDPEAAAPGFAPTSAEAGAVPAARVLAGIGNWADERIADEDGKRRRQTALILLMVVLHNLPMAERDRDGRLSLEDLVGPVDAWDPSIMDAVLRGLVRAAMATPARGRDYRAPSHLRGMLRAMALRARDARRRGAPDAERTHRALVRFAGWLHAAVAAVSPNHAADVIDGLDGYLPEADRDAIERADPHPTARGGAF